VLQESTERTLRRRENMAEKREKASAKVTANRRLKVSVPAKVRWGQATNTLALGVTNAGQIVGGFEVAGRKSHGFVTTR
jgi:hypothetical protein